MAFWGIELKPGKPYTHLYNNSRGRLHISQATLGDGKSTGKSVVQCNVGNNSPILLCRLTPNGSETCHLELEFEEVDEVIFSVIGQRSVYLSGYFLCSGRGTYGHESDSYGEDIAETDTDNSGSYNSEDEYESDFIDDGDTEMFSSSPQRKSSVVIEEIFDDEKPANVNASRRRLKKKCHVIDSDDGNAEPQDRLVVKGNGSTVLESEDEDGFPISFTLRRKNAVNNAQGNERTDDKELDEERKRKIDAISQNPESARETCQPCDASTQLEFGPADNVKAKKKKKDKDRKPVDTDPKSSAEERVSADQNLALEDKRLSTLNRDRVQLGKPKIDNKDLAVDVDGAENDGKPKIDNKDLAFDVDGAENDGKLKKKKKERVKKGKTPEAGVDLSTERSEGEGALNNDNMDQNLPSNVEPEKLDTSEDVVDHSLHESSRKLKKKNKKKRQRDENQQATEDKIDNGAEQRNPKEIEKIDEDLVVKQLPNDMGPGVNAEPAAFAAVDLHGAKKKKKKKSKNSEKDSNTKQESGDVIAAEEKNVVDEHKDGERPGKTREFPNGLTIEELSMGEPDGKRASPGRKVFVRYIGKLKNGKIFDSNVGRKPFGFRLGIGEVIKGWDVGVNGMRVGDKRRLVIPPSMGYGDMATGGNKIPGNSWLFFDVELVDVK